MRRRAGKQAVLLPARCEGGLKLKRSLNQRHLKGSCNAQRLSLGNGRRQGAHQRACFEQCLPLGRRAQQRHSDVVRCTGLSPASPDRACCMRVGHERRKAQRPLDSLQCCPVLNEQLRCHLFSRGAIRSEHESAIRLLKGVLLHSGCVSAAKGAQAFNSCAPGRRV